MAHDIRNPLSNIVLAASQIRGEAGEGQFFLDIIERNCARIDSLLTEWLAVWEPLEPRWELTDLGSLLQETIETHGAGLSEGHAPWGLDLVGGGAMLMEGDRGLLRQMIIELLKVAALPGKQLFIRVKKVENDLVLELLGTEGAMAWQEVRALEARRPRHGNEGICYVERVIAAHGGHISVGAVDGAIITIALPAWRKMPR